jgi:hypothetical protein
VGVPTTTAVAASAVSSQLPSALQGCKNISERYLAPYIATTQKVHEESRHINVIAVLRQFVEHLALMDSRHDRGSKSQIEAEGVGGEGRRCVG